MKKERYFLISGTIFGLVAVLHLLRLVNNWQFQIGPLDIPYWGSLFGCIVASGLCIWGYVLSRDT